MVCGGSRRRPCFSYKGTREEYVVLIEHLIDYASSTLSLSKTQDHQIQFIGAYLRLIGLFRSARLDGQPICIINRGWIWWWVNEQQQQQQQPTNDEILNLSPRIIPKMIIINWFPLVLPSTVGCRRELAPLSSSVSCDLWQKKRQKKRLRWRCIHSWLSTKWRRRRRQCL